MRIALIVIVVCSLALVSRLLGQPAGGKPAPPTGGAGSVKPDAAAANLAALVDDGNAFAADLYAQLAAGSKPGQNLFCSPASIHTALGMTYAGAGPASPTAEQMAKTLRFTLPAEQLQPTFGRLIRQLNHPTTMGEGMPPAYQLSVANALWGEKGYDFKPAFLALLRETYQAGLSEVEFNQAEAARQTINDWVAQQTKDKIQNLIGPGVLSPQTRLVLTNAVYFKSHWAEMFNKRLSKDEDFKLSADGAKTVKVPMMHQKHHFGYAETDELQVLSLPYMDGQLDMVVLLPKKADAASLAEIEKSLGAPARLGALELVGPGGQAAAPSKLGTSLRAIQPEEVDVALPKFKFSSEFKLAEALKALGMADAFDKDKADFSGMTSKGPLFIGEVLHKAFVAVDEDGTEAAAATASIMVAGSAMLPKPQPKVFRADHPFIFLIRHKATNTILFLGRLADPRS